MAHIFASIHHAVRSCLRFMMPVQRGSAEDERRIRFKVFLLNLFTLNRRKHHERRAEVPVTLLHCSDQHLHCTILVISRNGCTPVLVEPDWNTCNIEPEKIEAAIG